MEHLDDHEVVVVLSFVPDERELDAYLVVAWRGNIITAPKGEVRFVGGTHGNSPRESPFFKGFAVLGALLPPRRGHRHSLVAPPTSRFTGSTGIRQHYTLHPSPTTPQKNISGDTFRYRRWARRLV